MERRRRSVEILAAAGTEWMVRVYWIEQTEMIDHIADRLEEAGMGRAGKCEFDKLEFRKYKELFCAKPEAFSEE